MRALAFALRLTLALGLPLAAMAQAQAPLAVCLDAEHPPFSAAAAAGQGVDVGLAQALAQRLGRALQIVWVDIPRRGGLAKVMREQLDSVRCQLFTAVPVGDEPVPPRWRRSTAYAVLRYQWAAAPGAAAPADPPRQARAIGVVTATPADLYLYKQGLPRSPYPDNTALLTALARGEVPVALVWSAALATAAPRPSVAPQGPQDPALQTSLALVTRAAEPALGVAVENALAAMKADGTLARLLAEHGLQPDLLP